MGLRHQEYAKKLVLIHGIEDAIRIVKTSLYHARQGSNISYYDERDWNFNTKHLQFELPKNENKKVVGIKDKRVKETINFFCTVFNILNKEVKYAET